MSTTTRISYTYKMFTFTFHMCSSGGGVHGNFFVCSVLFSFFHLTFSGNTGGNTTGKAKQGQQSSLLDTSDEGTQLFSRLTDTSFIKSVLKLHEKSLY